MTVKATIVLFSHVSNTRSITGAEKLLFFFGRELSRYYNCILVAPHDGKLTRRARAAGLAVKYLSIPLMYGMYTPYAGLEADMSNFQKSKEYKELVDWLAEVKPAVVITSTCVHALPALAAKSLNIPVIWKISETITVNEYTPLSTALIHRNSDEILAISHTAAACFPGELLEEKVTQLPPSWDEGEMLVEAWSKLRGERRRELRVRPEERLVGYISSFINKEKGLEHFIRMAVDVAAIHPKTHFLVVGTAGDKSYYDRCVRKVKLEGLHSRFKFVGYEECLPAAYCAMDVLVVPSLIREGFGMTALEGLAFGKPVVAYDSGGLREILLTAGCGEYLIPPEDCAGLAHAVNTLLASPGLAAAVGSQARERIEAAYGPAAYRARLQGLAEKWNLRYCTSLPPAEDSGGVQVPPAADSAGGHPPLAAAAPNRKARKRRVRLRRSKPGRAKARAKRARHSDAASGRAARKRRTVKARRRKAKRRGASRHRRHSRHSGRSAA